MPAITAAPDAIATLAETATSIAHAPEGLTFAQALELVSSVTLETPIYHANRGIAVNVEVADEPYPASALDLVDLSATYAPRALRATLDFAKSKPFHGEEITRFRKLAALHLVLSDVYGINPILVRHPYIRTGFSGNSFFYTVRNVIGLVGKLSVLTYLHEFGHARGLGEQTGGKWAVNLFRRCFPASFSRLVPVGSAFMMPTPVVPALPASPVVRISGTAGTPIRRTPARLEVGEDL